MKPQWQLPVQVVLELEGAAILMGQLELPPEQLVLS